MEHITKAELLKKSIYELFQKFRETDEDQNGGRREEHLNTDLYSGVMPPHDTAPSGLG